MTDTPALGPHDVKYAAQRAYMAYGNKVDWTSVTGSPMPQWDQLGAPIQAAWIEAASAVVTFTVMTRDGQVNRSPYVGAHVHYTSRGSADGAYTPKCRAAVVTEVGDAHFRKANPLALMAAETSVGLFVMNPEGTYHLTIMAGGGGAAYDPVLWVGGSWHWAGQCPAP